jgi:hypothetical protein
MKGTNNSGTSFFLFGGRRNRLLRRTRQGASPRSKALPNTHSQFCKILDGTRIRVVTSILTVRKSATARSRAEVLRSTPSMAAACDLSGRLPLEKNSMLTATDGGRTVLWSGKNLYFGLGFVTCGKDARGRPRSSEISVAELSSLVRFSDTCTREAGIT